jgi:hypothetical protein
MGPVAWMCSLRPIWYIPHVGLMNKQGSMRGFTPFRWCAGLIVLWALSASLWAQPVGFGVNSRGDMVDPQQVNALWRIDLATGAVDYVGWTSYLDLEALALSPDGTLYGADDESKTLVRVSQVTGLAVPVGGTSNRHNMGRALDVSLDFGMTFDCEGSAYVVSDVEQTLFQADMDTGRLSVIGAPGSLGAPITDIAVRGDAVYGIGVGSPGANGAPASPNLYAIDLQNATAELIGPLGSQVSAYNNAGLSFDADGVLWAITDRRAVSGGDFPSEILRIDPATGLAEKVAETLVGVESLAIAPAGGCERGEPIVDDDGTVSVPLLSPPTLLALMLLMAGLGVARIRSLQS